jgi:hypothetical protein
VLKGCKCKKYFLFGIKWCILTDSFERGYSIHRKRRTKEVNKI